MSPEAGHPSPPQTNSPDPNTSPQKDGSHAITGERTLGWYAAREPAVVLVLSAIAVLAFLLVSGVSTLHKRELLHRGAWWASRGEADARADRLSQAANDFQVALTYSRDNFGYELSLARALAALNRTEEARAYLINLWQREPENGLVNLQLARIYAAKSDLSQALRYYHNAIYAVWGDNADAQQLSVCLELINFLLEGRAFNQAESELIAIGRNAHDPALRLQIADLFMKVPDYDRALDLYQQAIKAQHHNPELLAKAGQAAFELARYPLAEHYLTAALAMKPDNAESSKLLQLTKAIPKMDPYQFLSTTQRNRAVIADFNIAGERLNACLNTPSKDASANAQLQPLYAKWMDMKTRLNERSLRAHPDGMDSAMGLVFDIERETSNICGPPTGNDLVLFLIAKQHEGA